ncbi:hypothetical protein RJ641_033519, partial [Dillenia turbinata]
HVISLSKQLKHYKEHQKRIVGIAGDFLQNYYIDPLPYKVYIPYQFSEFLIESYTTFIQIAVTTLPPLGCLPAALVKIATSVWER